MTPLPNSERNTPSPAMRGVGELEAALKRAD